MLPFPAEWKDLLRRLDDESVLGSVVDALGTIAARQAERAGRQGRGRDETISRERARRLLERRETRLGAERRMVDELLRPGRGLDREASGPGPGAAIPQQELVLHGERGERAAGRFRLWNGGPRAQTFTFRVGRCDDGTLAPPTTFSPPEVTVEAGAAAVVRVQLDLGAVTDPAHLSIPVDVCAARTLSQRLWVEVQVS
jgi:hypothetical protein